MLSLRDKAPSYLLGKSQMVYMVTLAAFFSIFFLAVTLSLSTGPWTGMPAIEVFNFCVTFFIIALCAVIVDKRLQYLAGKKGTLTLGGYVAWNAAEALLVALLYCLYLYILPLTGRSVPDEITPALLVQAFAFCLIALGIPYLVAGMFFALQEKDNIIRMTNYADVVSDESLPIQDEQKITLFDNNGTLKLSVSQNNLYYIESDDNYIKVWYMDAAGVLKQYMLRCRLKTVEDSFRDSSLMRCNRKYIVNMTKVKVLSKEKGGYYLDLGTEAIDPIPVTKTYEEAILTRFNSR